MPRSLRARAGASAREPPSTPCCCQELLVHGHGVRNHPLERVPLSSSRAACLSHGARELRIGEDPADGGGGGFRPTRRNEEPLYAVVEELWNASDTGRHDWNARGHRLEDGIGARLVITRQEKAGRFPQQAGQVSTGAPEKANGAVKPGGANKAFDIGPLRTVTDDPEFGIGMVRSDAPNDLDREIWTFLRGKAADEQDSPGPGLPTSGEAFELDAVRDHSVLVGSAHARGDPVIELSLGERHDAGAKVRAEPLP